MVCSASRVSVIAFERNNVYYHGGATAPYFDIRSSLFDILRFKQSGLNSAVS